MTINDLSNFDDLSFQAKAQFLRDLFARVTTILTIHCTGYLLVYNDDVDERYMKLIIFINDLLKDNGFEEIRNSIVELLPKSLYSLGEDIDIDWEEVIRPEIFQLKGDILDFCLRVNARYDDVAMSELFIKPLDKFIDEYQAWKNKVEKNWLQNVETSANKTRENTMTIYVDLKRIDELRLLKSKDFDLTKLIGLVEEINKCYGQNCYFATAMLARAIVDHVPPIFGCKTFAEVSNNYGGGSKSFKHSMANLENSLRKIADAHLHVQIRSKEVLPNRTQINFANDLDVLLAEIVRLIK